MTFKHNDLFKLPNNIFNAGLNTSELMVLAAVYSLKSSSVINGRKYIKINQKSIATICGFKSVSTVSKAINQLCRLGYIEHIDRYYVDSHKLGSYVYTIPVVKGRSFFFVNRRVFKYKLTTAQMRLYLFCCKCADSCSKRFWNSYNDICQQLNIKRSAVIKTMAELIEMGLIKRYRLKKKNGSYSDNNYKIVTLRLSKYKFKGKKRRRCFALNAFSAFSMNVGVKPIPTFNNIIMRNIKKVNPLCKYFFDLRGSPKIFNSLYSTHSYSNRRRKNIRLYLKYRCNLKLHNL